MRLVLLLLVARTMLAMGVAQGLVDLLGQDIKGVAAVEASMGDILEEATMEASLVGILEVAAMEALMVDTQEVTVMEA